MTFLPSVNGGFTYEENGVTVIRAKTLKRLRIILFYKKEDGSVFSVTIDTTMYNNKYLEDMKISMAENYSYMLLKTFFIFGDFSLCKVDQGKERVAINVKYGFGEKLAPYVTAENKDLYIGSTTSWLEESEDEESDDEESETEVSKAEVSEAEVPVDNIQRKNFKFSPIVSEDSDCLDYFDDEESCNEGESNSINGINPPKDDTNLTSEDDNQLFSDIQFFQVESQKVQNKSRPVTPIVWQEYNSSKAKKTFSDVVKKGQVKIAKSDLSKNQKRALMNVASILERDLEYAKSKGGSFIWINDFIKLINNDKERNYLCVSLSFYDKTNNPKFKDGFWNVSKDKEEILAKVSDLVNDYFREYNKPYLLEQTGGSISCCKVRFL